MLPRVSRFLLCAAVCALTAVSHAQTDGYPSRPVTLLVGTAPGGSTDSAARIIANKLGPALGQSVVVDPRPGGNGMIAAQFLSKAAPDGHTLYLSLGSLVQNIVFHPQQAPNLDSLEPVMLVARTPYVLAVGSNVPAKTVAELMSLARSKPEGVTYGSWGTGSGAHIAGVILAQKAGAKFIHVPYKGESAAYPDLLRGDLAAMYGSAGFFSTRMGPDQKFKVLAITAPERFSRLPDVPTMAEAGYPEANFAGWGGIFAPKGTPPRIVARLATEIGKILKEPQVSESLLNAGYVVAPNTPADFREMLVSEIKTWTDVVARNNIKLE